MDFIVEKDPGLIPQVLSKILDSCVNGVSLADPDQEDMPLVYVNKAFETITGYTLAETVGKNCRFLQGNEHDQAEIKQRAAHIDRSKMNVAFNLATPALEAEFATTALAAGFSGLAGHRSIGGIRASLYNGLQLPAVEELANFMADFRARHR